MGQEKIPTSYEKQLVALGRTLQILREEENVEVLIETTLQYLEAEFDYKLLWIGLYDRVEHKLKGIGGRSPNNENPALKQRFILTPGDLLEQVVIQQRPVGVPDLREEQRAGEWRKIAQKCNIQGTLIFPMRYKDRCFGIAVLGSTLWGVSPRADEKARLSIILGGLAAALYQIETDWQRQQQKNPQSLYNLLAKLRGCRTLDASLEAVVEQTHKFISPNRTNIYWYYPERRYFWRRVGNYQKTPSFGDFTQPASGVMVSDLGSFYQALLCDQLVAIGEAHSSLKADVTLRLMQQIRARSLLAAPIIFQNELLGFLAVEGNDPRIWQEEEKNYVRAAAQLLSLIAPLSTMETTIEQVKLDSALSAGITHAIYTDSEWKQTLQTASEQLLGRLKADRFLVLNYNQENHQFDIIYQSHPPNRRPINSPLATPGEVDTKMLQDSPEAIAIENWNEDLKLMAWRPAFFDLGARSLLICSTSPGHLLEGLVMVCCDTARSWSYRERELVGLVSRQISLISHQWELQDNSDKQRQLFSTLLSAVGNLQQSTFSAAQLERTCLQQVAEIMSVPLAALVTWWPGQTTGRIIAPTVRNAQFAVKNDLAVPVQTDALVQWALLQTTPEPLFVQAVDLPLETRAWLCGPSISQILVMALRTSPGDSTTESHQPTGILLVADGPERRWSPDTIKLMVVLVKQLAWSRREIMLTATLVETKENLECLNWYKHRHLEDFYRNFYSGLKKLNELAEHQGTFGNLQVMRLQQILRQLNANIQSMRPLIKREQWEMSSSQETITAATLLRRSLERLEGIIQGRQLWTQVHSEGHLTISGDLMKIEWVFYEVLLAAARRSPQGGRIDIWCRQSHENGADLSVTDSGIISPALLADLQALRSADLLAPSPLDEPPGLHLAICRRIILQLGGELNFFQLEDGRITSQLILPLSSTQFTTS
ncbi:GAF domain-containing protein [Ancylothrix sp. C2]|uniref:GAF domain-containing sensor histidine kinase n=1 Tax=Ancylothrix sp. D3o TaxID=2953691 RepID=UPI0021BB94E5|nr:GAF domain-containing protein [Ancylothrix sp. D3o]MCT7948571.1 GAF domain-containing protein [Ancylothrix sp. D3o]